MVRTMKCGDFGDCSDCTLRNCPNLAPLDWDDQECLSAGYFVADDEEPSDETLMEIMEGGY